MYRSALSALCLAAVFGTAALAKVDNISKVTVTADVTAIQHEKATAYWSNVATGLENAIVARLVGGIADDGATISVGLREGELASSFERALNLSDAVLVGQVNLSDLNDNTNFDAHEQSVTRGTLSMVSEDGTTTPFDSLETPEAYATLINTFANEVAERLD